MSLWPKQWHAYHPPVITIFTGGKYKVYKILEIIPSHGWLMAGCSHITPSHVPTLWAVSRRAVAQPSMRTSGNCWYTLDIFCWLIFRQSHFFGTQDSRYIYIYIYIVHDETHTHWAAGEKSWPETKTVGFSPVVRLREAFSYDPWDFSEKSHHTLGTISSTS